MTFDIVIYHADCIDGFTAAWVAHTFLGDFPQYVPAKYGDAPPDVVGKRVLIVDFSYSRDILIKMAADVSEPHHLLVLDHHKTAQTDCEGLDFCVFDMARSGAGLAWDVLRSDELRPMLIDYVEDRDLWRWKLPNSKAINAWLSIITRDFTVWDRTAKMFAERPNAVAALGEAVLGHIDTYVQETGKNARTMRIAGQHVPVINCPGMMASELIGKLAETASFAVGWFQRADGRYQYSLRSRGEYDVSLLAKHFGGGGHMQSAGFASEYQPDHLFDGTELQMDVPF
jgi:oligoribonuclease NrnB/cAMP/cGMP phosphodiesterase (DHH superfamily)